mgnify:CR=1 FL=1
MWVAVRVAVCETSRLVMRVVRSIRQDTCVKLLAIIAFVNVLCQEFA